MVRWFYRVVLLLLLLLTYPASAAQPSEADRATARALAVEGYRALQRKDFEVAADRFRRADALVHAPTLVVDHARALTGLGQLVQAYQKYELVLREGVDAKAPVSWKQAIVDAETEIAKLKKRLAWLTITVSGPNSPRVTIDGDVVPPSELGVLRPVNPGKRTVRVTAPGFQKAVRTVTLTEGDEDRVDVILASAVREEDVEPAFAPAQNSNANQTPASAPSDGETRRTLAYAALGIGGVGIVTGGVFGILALNKRSELKDACSDGDCPPSQRTNLETYHTFGTLSGVGFGVGIVAAGVGITLLATGKSRAKPESARGPSIETRVGLGTISAMGEF